jgi:hypothetical protein
MVIDYDSALQNDECVWDAQVFRNRIETGWMGLGGVILHDVAGSGNLTSTKVYVLLPIIK